MMPIIDSATLAPMVCDAEGCGALANFVWYGGWDGKPKRCCDTHNPMSNVAMPLPMNFTGHTMCPTCGK